MTDKGPCPTCGTPDAVDLADGWTKRLDDLYSERVAGAREAERTVLEFLRGKDAEDFIREATESLDYAFDGTDEYGYTAHDYHVAARALADKIEELLK